MGQGLTNHPQPPPLEKEGNEARGEEGKEGNKKKEGKEEKEGYCKIIFLKNLNNSVKSINFATYFKKSLKIIINYLL